MLVSDYFPNVEELRYSNVIAGNSSSKYHLRIVVSGPKKRNSFKKINQVLKLAEFKLRKVL